MALLIVASGIVLAAPARGDWNELEFNKAFPAISRLMKISQEHRWDYLNEDSSTVITEIWEELTRISTIATLFEIHLR